MATNQPNVKRAAGIAGALIESLCSPFNNDELTPTAVGLLQGVMHALNIDTLSVSDSGIEVVDRATEEC